MTKVFIYKLQFFIGNGILWQIIQRKKHTLVNFLNSLKVRYSVRSRYKMYNLKLKLICMLILIIRNLSLLFLEVG